MKPETRKKVNFWTSLFIIGMIVSYLIGWELHKHEDLKQIKGQQSELYDLVATQNMFIEDFIAFDNFSIQALDVLSKEIMENRAKSLDRDIELAETLYERTKKVPYKRLVDSTVVMYQKSNTGQGGRLGTGVLVKVTEDFTYLLTNAHVIEKCDTSKCYVISKENDKRELEVVKISSFDYDMALVRIPGKLFNKIPIKGIQAGKIQERVYMVGHNQGRLFIYAEGYVAGYDVELQKSLVVGIPIGPGNSGSGVINANGELVGLVYGMKIVPHFPYLTVDLAQALCVDGNVIKLFLKDLFDE